MRLLLASPEPWKQQVTGANTGIFDYDRGLSGRYRDILIVAIDKAMGTDQVTLLQVTKRDCEIIDDWTSA